MPLSISPCDLDGWTLDPNCFDVPDGTPPEVIEANRRAAAEYLFAASGNRFRSCPVTVRPCRKSCADAYGSLFGPYYNQGQSTGGWIPYLSNGRMYNASLCGCTSECHCGPDLCQVYLPGPVFSIDLVQLDDTVIPATWYNLLDARYLVFRSDTPDDVLPDGCVPSCQDMSLPPGQPGTFAVTYRTGLPVPQLGIKALTDLTAHYIRGCSDCGCGISNVRQNNVTSVTRQGVSYDFVDPTDARDAADAGIESVAQFLRAYNPNGLSHAGRVLSPDAPKRPRIWGLP